MKHLWKNTQGNRTVLIAAAIAAVFSLTAFSTPGHMTLSLPVTAKTGIVTGSGSIPAKMAVPVPQAGIGRKEVPISYAPASSEYDNKAVANVTDVLNLRAMRPSSDLPRQTIIIRFSRNPTAGLRFSFPRIPPDIFPAGTQR